MLVYVFRARTVTAKQYARPAHSPDGIACDADVLCVKVRTDRGRAGVTEGAVSNRTVFSPAKTKSGIIGIVHIPVVLDAFGFYCPDVAVCSGKG